MAFFTDNDRLRWVSEGQRVTLALDDGRGLQCVVVKAAGDSAQIEAASKTGAYADLRLWVDVSQLFPAISEQDLARARAERERAQAKRGAT